MALRDDHWGYQKPTALVDSAWMGVDDHEILYVPRRSAARTYKERDRNRRGRIGIGAES